MKKLALIWAFCASGMAFAEGGSEWRKILETDGQCNVQASFWQLEGMPFGKIEITDGTQKTTVPMVRDYQSYLAGTCEPFTFTSVYRDKQPLGTPTYLVSGVDLCMGRLPTFTLQIALSGVAKDCPLRFVEPSADE